MSSRSILVLSITLAALAHPVSAQAIKKCQDAEGRWHYGDNAAAACGDAGITVLNKKGETVKEIERVPTAEEVEARRAEQQRLEAERQLTRERETARKRLLNVYPTEESIIRARDQRLESLDKQIALNETMLDEIRLNMKQHQDRPVPKDAKAKANYDRRTRRLQADMDEYGEAISKMRQERERTSQKYDMLLEEFRNLTGTAPPATR